MALQTRFSRQKGTSGSYFFMEGKNTVKEQLRRAVGITVLSVITSATFACKAGTLSAQRVDPRLVARAEQITRDRFSFTTQTPRGATVASVRQPDAGMLSAIDQGLT